MRCLIGWVYCILWYCSILAGYAGLFCPLFPVLFVSNKLYRYCADLLFTFWQIYPTALLELLCKTEVQISGDVIEADETSLVVMNHRTRTDWNFLWPAAYHATVGAGRFKHPIKFILKDIIRHIPGPGWVMQLACFLYIKRAWICDKRKLQNLVDYFCALTYKFTLLLFPEGTDLTETTKEISDKYAKQNGLGKYEYVLHPRTTGFSFLAHRLLAKHALDALYDVTLVYCDSIPQSERLLLKGEFPKLVKMHFSRYPAAILPRTESGLKDFLEKRWSEKEKVIKEFYATGNFLHGCVLRRNKPSEIYAALIFWTVLPYVTAYLFATIDCFRNIVLAHTLFLLLVNFVSDGFQEFEIAVFNFKKRIFGRPF